jgi:2-oxoglutarate ferredoxin oxidoreductase subunit delta
MKYRVEIDTERCKGCRLCIEECPKALLQIAEKLNKKGWQSVEFNCKTDCIGCKKCATVCPDTAIRIVKED